MHFMSELECTRREIIDVTLLLGKSMKCVFVCPLRKHTRTILYRKVCRLIHRSKEIYKQDVFR